MPHIPEHLEQSEEQRQATFRAADLSAEQISAVERGVRAGTPVTSTITSTDLANRTAPTITQPEPVIPPSIKDLPKAEIPKVEQPKQDFSSLLGRVEEIAGQVEGFKPAATPELASAQSRLIEANERLARFEIKAEQAAEAALQRGETTTFASGEAARVRREAAFESLTLSASIAAATDRVRLAKELSADANEAKFAELESQARAQRANIVNNYDKFTKAEKARADSALLRLDKEDAFIAEQKAAEKAKSDAVFEAVKERDIKDQSIIEDALAAGSAVEALQVINERAPVIKEKDLQFVSGTENQPSGVFDKKTGVFTPLMPSGVDDSSDIGILGAEFGTPAFAYNEILKSAQFGDQRLNDSRLEKLDQAQLALSGVQSLNSLLFQGEDGINLTGPIKGRVRKLVSSLGGDADAAAINAIIQGLIPTVARGIFGEVGVLTDTDINNYKKTITNLTSTEDQNRLVSVIMLDVLSRSYENTLLNSARNQTNVSGFAQSYLDIRQRIENEKLKLGVTAFSGLNSEELLDAVPETKVSSNFRSSFNDFMNIGNQFKFPQ